MIRRRRGVALATAFGSAVLPHGEPAELDIAVLFERGLDLRDILGVIGDLTDATGLQQLDVADLNSAGPFSDYLRCVAAYVGG